MTEQVLPHQLILTDRRQLMLSGVCDVDTFDESTVTLHTTLGVLPVKGTSLQVQRLNIETGDLTVDGHIDRLEYAAEEDKRGRLARWFR